MQRRVLAGEDRRPARRTGGGSDIVAMKLDASLPQRVLGFELSFAPRFEGVGFIRDRVTLFVHHEDEKVRSLTFDFHRFSFRAIESAQPMVIGAVDESGSRSPG